MLNNKLLNNRATFLSLVVFVEMASSASIIESLNFVNETSSANLELTSLGQVY